MGRFSELLTGKGLFARALRGSALTAGGYAVSQALRLASNLILTRLLLPDAFGLMALVSVFMVGLTLFSDVGISPAISQHPDGDDRDFLNTAFTIQAGRGFGLWLLTCVIAWPAAWFYEAPMLAQLLPVSGLALLIGGFYPTRIETAARHLSMGRVVGLDLLSQVIGLVFMVAMAIATESVWALAAGGIVGSVAKLVLTSAYLPGIRNQFHWNSKAAHELIHFGKWIFLSTACTFVLMQGDRAILGANLTLEELGIYNIAYFLGSFPLLLGMAVTTRILIPLYRSVRETPSPETDRKLRRMRFGMTGALLAMLAFMAFFGVPLVHLLYRADYAGAGPIVVAIACLLMTQVIGLTYDQSALGAGDSRSYFYLTAARAIIQTGLFLLGAVTAGLGGALLGQAVAMLVVHPLIVLVARKNRVWDARHDAIYFALAVGIAALAWWINAAELASLWA